jgi:hypothetical protein
MMRPRRQAEGPHKQTSVIRGVGVSPPREEPTLNEKTRRSGETSSCTYREHSTLFRVRSFSDGSVIHWVRNRAGSLRAGLIRRRDRLVGAGLIRRQNGCPLLDDSGSDGGSVVLEVDADALTDAQGLLVRVEVNDRFQRAHIVELQGLQENGAAMGEPV